MISVQPFQNVDDRTDADNAVALSLSHRQLRSLVLERLRKRDAARRR